MPGIPDKNRRRTRQDDERNKPILNSPFPSNNIIQHPNGDSSSIDSIEQQTALNINNLTQRINPHI